jgi:hypothetical protein
MVYMAKGKKIPQELIDEIGRLRMLCSPPRIIQIMKGRVSPRSVYRILQRLKVRDQEQQQELEERVSQAMKREEVERLRRARLRGVRPFRTVSQILPRARVRAV